MVDYAFVTGMGRSGTKFFASLLAQSNEASSFHEYIGDREYWLLSWYLQKENYAIPYLEREKKKVDSIRKGKLFIDVNSGLQNSVEAINDVFPDAKIFHLVRDPRRVVASIYNRRSEKRTHLVPKSKDEFVKWMEAGKLEQVCWNWNDATRRLIDSNCDIIIFERLVSDYDYFLNEFCRKIGISDISMKTWEKVKEQKVNSTRSKPYRFIYSFLKKKDYVKENLPKFEEWSDEQKRVLYEICGETMEKIGYKAS